MLRRVLGVFVLVSGSVYAPDAPRPPASKK